MKRYFRIIFRALCGLDPIQRELDGLRREYELVARQVFELEKVHKELLIIADKDEKRIKDLQSLVENLRNRLNEKDVLIENIKKDYQGRIERYVAEIDKLKQHGYRTGN